MGIGDLVEAFVDEEQRRLGRPSIMPPWIPSKTYAYFWELPDHKIERIYKADIDEILQ
jgi:hypothetical protein